jgi:hypothetical protein
LVGANWVTLDVHLTLLIYVSLRSAILANLESHTYLSFLNILQEYLGNLLNTAYLLKMSASISQGAQLLKSCFVIVTIAKDSNRISCVIVSCFKKKILLPMIINISTPLIVLNKVILLWPSLTKTFIWIEITRLTLWDSNSFRIYKKIYWSI